MHEILPEITKSRKSTFQITNTFGSEKSNHKFRKLNKVINLLNNRVSWIRSKWIRICLQIRNKISVNECDRKCNWKNWEKEREKYRKIWNVVGEMRNVFEYVTSIAMDDLHLWIRFAWRHFFTLKNLHDFSVTIFSLFFGFSS